MRYIKKAMKSAESNSQDARKVVERMLEEIREGREDKVKELAKKFDNWDQEFILTEEKKKELIAQVPDHVKRDLEFAHKQVSGFAKAQRDSIKEFNFEATKGIILGQKIIPMAVAGCYVPGGRFAHACSAIMSIATAKAAGVPFVVAATPPRGSHIDPATCYAMHISGADVILEMGGVQAIATMAYGLFTGKPANILVGPGNAYVAEAKALLSGSGLCGIDVFAGPTESAVICDETADPMTVAIDLVSQAEHGFASPVWLFTSSEKVAERVMKIMPKLCADMPNTEVALTAWNDYGEILFSEDREELAKWSDIYAPEHVQVMTKDLDWWRERLQNYGSLFLGEGSTVPHGDKCSGTNHILPTKKAGYYSGGLNVHKFLKICTYQHIDENCNDVVGAAASRLSRVEGMEGHARACDWRLRKFYPDREWDFYVYEHPKYQEG